MKKAQLKLITQIKYQISYYFCTICSGIRLFLFFCTICSAIRLFLLLKDRSNLAFNHSLRKALNRLKQKRVHVKILLLPEYYPLRYYKKCHVINMYRNTKTNLHDNISSRSRGTGIKILFKSSLQF